MRIQDVICNSPENVGGTNIGPYTPGSVIFVDNDSNFNENNSHFKWFIDDASLGIGLGNDDIDSKLSIKCSGDEDYGVLHLLKYNGNTILYAGCNGFIGIGTNNPDTFILQVKGDIGPDDDDISSLGSPDKKWKDLYLGSSSLYLNNLWKIQILSDNLYFDFISENVSIIFNSLGGIILPYSYADSDQLNTLYNIYGNLYWNGIKIDILNEYGGILLEETIPDSNIENILYNYGGDLYWSGSQLITQVSGTANYIPKFNNTGDGIIDSDIQNINNNIITNNCSSSGNYNIVLGYRSVADHDGCFIYSDYQEEDFYTTGNNQFLIRASSGVGINTEIPMADLDICNMVRIFCDGRIELDPTNADSFDINIGLANIDDDLYWNGEKLNNQQISISGTPYYIPRFNSSGNNVENSNIKNLLTDIITNNCTLTNSGNYNNLFGISCSLSNTSKCSIFGGENNYIHDCNYSSIFGGINNEVKGYCSSILNGDYNRINNFTFSCIFGGIQNSLSSSSTIKGYSCILSSDGCGISSNHAIILNSTFSSTNSEFSCILSSSNSFINGNIYNCIINGYYSNINGNYNIAIGYRAQINHDGCFIYSDYQEEDFSTSGDNQFLVRASGGVGINTEIPMADLDVCNMVKIFCDGRIEIEQTTSDSGEIDVGLVNINNDLYWNSKKLNYDGYITRQEINTDYYVNISDYYIGILSGTTNIYLPPASSCESGKIFIFKDENGIAFLNNIIINADGSDLIDGNGSYTININYGKLTLVSNGNNRWCII